MNLFNIFKNNFYRLLAKKAIILVAIVFVPLMIVGGVYFNSKMEAKASIAVVTSNKKLNISNKYMSMKVVKEKPTMSDLVLNKYDAVIEDNGKGDFKITTIKSDKLKNQIEGFLKNPSSVTKMPNSKDKRGVGTSIIGFLIMIVLILEINLMLFYPEDRDFGTFKRILISPVSGSKYLMSQGVFDFLVAFVPTYVAVILVNAVFNVNIGFSYIQFGGLLALLMLLGTAFALFITSLIDDVDNAAMLGNAIILITSILSGTFYSFTDDNKILNTLVSAIPFKPYLALVQGIENGKSLTNYCGELTYVLAVILVLFSLGTFITKRNLKTGRY
ncbi:ABC transporter permease [Clostridium neuense]|uniref:ABC transporter permease n=1 Tax=Clostridium neuense TaxID=1728934 RepID=A0ABW8TD36_9CLOT